MPETLTIKFNGSLDLSKLCRLRTVIIDVASEHVGDSLNFLFSSVGNIVVIKTDITTIDGCYNSRKSVFWTLHNNW